MTSSIETARDDRGVITVTLARPERHNAFDDAMIAELSACFADVAADETAQALVLRGAGKSFSAGADLGWMQRMADFSFGENLADARALAGMLAALDTLPVATIACVQGAAFGGGVGLVACCDIALAGERATFALSEVRLGLVPATIGPYVLAAIGARAARRYFLTGERFDAPTAQRIGLVSEVVPADGLDRRVEAVLSALLEAGPQAKRHAKALVLELAGKTGDAATMEATSRLIAELRGSEEGREGLAAFLEKRAPAWRPGGD